MTNYDENNIFAKILRGEIPAARIFDNEHCLAIMDAFPQSKGHCLIVPRAPSRNILDADPAQLALVIPYVQQLAKAARSALMADGIRIVQFNEPTAGQSVFHLHWHIIPVYEGQELKPHATGMADATELEE
ncbi:MAG TPA: HIT domain-containing protein, partial [Devosia sp.]|nr:HIT domain-containing protein [Devosia sp.]